MWPPLPLPTRFLRVGRKQGEEVYVMEWSWAPCFHHKSVPRRQAVTAPVNVHWGRDRCSGCWPRALLEPQVSVTIFCNIKMTIILSLTFLRRWVWVSWLWTLSSITQRAVNRTLSLLSLLTYVCDPFPMESYGCLPFIINSFSHNLSFWCWRKRWETLWSRLCKIL